MPLTGKDILRKALKAGWIEERVTGNHHILVKNNQSVAIPVHANRDLKCGIERKLLKDLGL